VFICRVDRPYIYSGITHELLLTLIAWDGTANWQLNQMFRNLARTSAWTSASSFLYLLLVFLSFKRSLISSLCAKKTQRSSLCAGRRREKQGYVG
jgi:hypothetical protein